MKPKLILSDFDGTLTNENGDLIPVFFDILSLLKVNKIPLIIVTGRSLSWGHFLMTHFKIDGVIAEGGGVYFDKNEREHLNVNQETLLKLNKITQKLLKTFPIKLTSDSFGRKTDRAIELRDLNKKKESDITLFLEKEGAQYSKSNVHLNYWVGNISKAKASFKVIKKLGISPDECLIFGDSRNDESLFKAFPYSVGVSSIKRCLSDLTYKPQIILNTSKDSPQEVFEYLKSVL